VNDNETRHDASPEETVTLDSEFCSRLKRVREYFERPQKEMDSFLGIGKGSWQRYERGQTPGSQVVAGLAKLGINTNWLLTGEGPMLAADLLGLHDAGKRSPAFQDAISRIEALFEGEDEFPLPASRLAARPELGKAKQELIEISSAQDATPIDRARADKVLQLAYGDEEATTRAIHRQMSLRDRVKGIEAAFNEAAEAADWKPPAIVAQAITGAMMFHGLTAEGALYQLHMLKAQEKAYKDECRAKDPETRYDW
jgi:hypothetical protein